MKTFDESAMDVKVAMGSDAVIRVWGFLVPG